MYRVIWNHFTGKTLRQIRLSYEDHYNLLIEDTTEFAGSYTRNFRKLGIDAKCIIANDTVLQKKWKSENKINSEKNSDILFEQLISLDQIYCGLKI